MTEEVGIIRIYYKFLLLVEFESKAMRTYFKEKGIEKYASRTGDTKAAFAETYIRIFKEKVYRYFSTYNTTRWIDVVEKILNGMNNSVNKTTGYVPNQVTPKISIKIWDKLYRPHTFLDKENYKIYSKKLKFKQGDTVRLSKAKGTFEKG